LVKPATENRIPPTRPSTSAWLDTSMTTAATPDSLIAASSACNAGASGVVRTLGTSVTVGAPSGAVPRVRVWTVPISPVPRPAAASPDSTR
jgi:hypothetical protein